METIKKHAVSAFVIISILLTTSAVRANETEVALDVEHAEYDREGNEPLIYFINGSEAPQRKGDVVETMLDVVLWDLTQDLPR